MENKSKDHESQEPADQELDFDAELPFGLPEGNPEAVLGLAGKDDHDDGLDETKKSENGASHLNGGPAIAPQSSEEDRDARSVYVKNVHFAAEKSEIEEHFRDSGEINMITILKNKITHQPLGYCYIEFKTKQGAANAL